MSQSTLKAKRRSRLGKSGAREVRSEGNIPAILYGKYTDPIPLIINPDDLKRALSKESGRNTILHLEIESEEEPVTFPSLLRDVQIDHLSSKAIHIDLQAVNMDEKIHLRVPIEFVGRAAGVKEGGLLEIAIRRLDVECLPTNVPNSIKIDVTHLTLGESIHVEDLELPEGVTTFLDDDETVATVLIPRGMTVETEVPEVEEEVEEGEDEGDEEAEEKAEAESDDEKEEG